MPDSPVFIDLFSGCGGLSLGLLNSGWKGAFAIERTSDAFSTYKHNLIDSGQFEYEWPEWLPQKEHDIKIFIENFKNNLIDLKGQVDLIAGGPPCQGFSPAGQRNPSDPRNKMAKYYIEIVKIIKPKLLLLENVRGINNVFSKDKKTKLPYSLTVKKQLEKAGYLVEYQVVKSSDWGVPQLRPRFILIAIRKDLQKEKLNIFKKLNQTREFFLTTRGLSISTPQTTMDAIDDLKTKDKELVENNDSPVKGFREIAYQAPKKPSPFVVLMRTNVGNNQIPNSLRLPRHKTEIIERFKLILEKSPKGKTLSKEQRAELGIKKHSITPLCPNLPSATMTTLPDDYLHYSEPRILTVREMARLQSFPDWFEFKGQYTTGGKLRKVTCPRYTQVGNAVPPLLGEALGELLLATTKSLTNGATHRPLMSAETGTDIQPYRSAVQDPQIESYQQP